MDTQKIKKLKDRLSISLSEAKELLDESDDLFLCEQMYHNNNINTICRLTECDENIANYYYRLMNFDVQKAIEKIYNKLFFYTAAPNETIDKIGFILWEENDSLDKYITSRDRSLFIQSKDFEIVMPNFKSMFPLKNPFNEEVQESFDVVSNNFFSNRTCREIVQKMATIKTEDPNIELFLRNLINWFQIRLRYADYIVVYGNL